LVFYIFTHAFKPGPSTHFLSNSGGKGGEPSYVAKKKNPKRKRLFLRRKRGKHRSKEGSSAGGKGSVPTALGRSETR